MSVSETDDEPLPEPKGSDQAEVEAAIEQVELGADDTTDSGGLFTGTEDADELGGGGTGTSSTSDGDDQEASDGDQGDGEDVDPLGDLDGNSAAMESSINEGLARLAVVGLTDDDFDGGGSKDSLETELSETFEAFRVGHFGSRCVDEYLLLDDGDEVDPAWGLAGGLFVAAALTVWLRPDGNELVGGGSDAISDLVGGLA